MTDRTANLAPLPGVFPDQMALVVRHGREGPERPLFAFAGPWRPWTGTRGTKAEPAGGEHHLFAFLTYGPSRDVDPIRPKADRLLQRVAQGEKQGPPTGSPEMAPALLL